MLTSLQKPYITELFDLVQDVIDGKLIKHERNINQHNDVISILTKVFYDLPTTTIHITTMDNISYVISNYSLLDILANVITKDNDVKFNVTNCLFTVNDGIPIKTIYDNRELFMLIRNNNFSETEIDNLRLCHNQLHKYCIPVTKISSVGYLDKYLELR